MLILLLPSPFKDCMDARTAGDCIKKGIERSGVKAEIQIIPIADGGPGTVKTIMEVLDGKWMTTSVHDPLMRSIDAKWAILNQNTALIEMAAANGLELLSAGERNPLKTSTFGTGELIKASLDAGCRKIYIGIGGSATNDGGVGMVMALGIKYLNAKQENVSLGGENLNQIENIDLSAIDPRLKETEIKVLCDVTNPLTGINGASAVYGPQKGATPTMVKLLDENLKHMANKIREQLKMDVENIPGSGAAGGLGAGLVAFTGAKLVPGFETIAQLINLEQHISDADLVISTEGSIDEQTLQGKAISGICRFTKKYHKPLIVFAGNTPFNQQPFIEKGITAIYNINPENSDLKTSLALGPSRLEEKVAEILKTYVKR
jgi:glycerate kinase